MANGKLPTYFKEYLDERFKSVLEEIQGVKDDVKDVKTDVSELKKTVIELQSIKPIVKKNDHRTSKMIIALVFISIALAIHLLVEGSEGASFLSKILTLLL